MPSLNLFKHTSLSGGSKFGGHTIEGQWLKVVDVPGKATSAFVFILTLDKGGKAVEVNYLDHSKPANSGTWAIDDGTLVVTIHSETTHRDYVSRFTSEQGHFHEHTGTQDPNGETIRLRRI